MEFTVKFAEDSDFEAMMPIMFGAMAGGSQFVNAVYPQNMTKEGQSKHCQTFLHLKSIDPTQRWLKATDKETGKIVGVAQWCLFDDPKNKPPEVELDGPPGTWDTQDDKEWAQALFHSYMEEPRKVIREATGPVMFLIILTIAKEYQFRGVGTALTRWGTELADKLNAECMVQSNTAARYLYEQHGFVLQQHLTLAVPEKFSDRQKERLFYMYRPKKSSLGTTA